MRFVILISTFLFLFNITDSKCVESYAILCDGVSDIIKYGKKQWNNLVIKSNECENTTDKEILEEQTMERCPNLEELYIVDRLQTIHPKSFKILTNLVYLNLYKNNLKIVPNEMFAGLLNIYKIELKYNNIQGIAQGAFNNMPSLKTINLANNKLNHIGKNTFNFNSLRKLIISNNILSTISANAFANNLEILDLSSNYFRRLDDNLFLNLKNMKELILSRNKLKKLQENMFAGLDNLFKLDVSHNEIDTIEVRTFDNLRTMKLLQLAHNQLKIIKPDVFPKNNALLLQSLRLDHNKLSFLSLDIFNYLLNLRRISIGGNPWQCLCLHYMQLEMNKLNISFTPCDYNHYFTGKNPSCMQFKTDECVENVEFVGEDFPRLYFQALQNFSYDCP